jgi:GNAT superfamily N-acetyltransferase
MITGIDMAFSMIPISKLYSYKNFDCGNENLNNYLRFYALKNDSLGFGRTYLTLNDSNKVVGYFTLSNANVAHEAMPEETDVRLPRYPVPALLLSRLAVDKTMQGQGLGRRLLVQAFEKALEIAEISGVYAMIVDAIDEKAKAFYLKHGFIELPHSNLALIISLKKIREAFAIAEKTK